MTLVLSYLQSSGTCGSYTGFELGLILKEYERDTMTFDVLHRRRCAK